MRPCPHALVISIHAPRAGSDSNDRTEAGALTVISIHAPRAGSDETLSCEQQKHNKFQSTLPVRGATNNGGYKNGKLQFQSTLPVRGATRGFGRGLKNVKNFNPRSPCGERRTRKTSRRVYTDFNPRSPCGERLCSWRLSLQRAGISIHAPRAGSDPIPNPLRAGRQGFQSTLPVRGATHNCDVRIVKKDISIHAPRAGSDL